MIENIKTPVNKEKPNSLHSEHLKDGIKPIIGGVYDRHNLDLETQYFLDGFRKNAEFINFTSSYKELEEGQMLNSGVETYVMSSCSSRDKYSDAFLDCTGVVMVGKDKLTGKNISFLCHQNPLALFEHDEVRENFKEDLNKNLKELKEKSEEGSMDVVVFGGNRLPVDFKIDENYKPQDYNENDFNKDEFTQYEKSIKFLNYNLEQKLGFSPTVLLGPNNNFDTSGTSSHVHTLSVYFDNENRRLYMLRPKQDLSIKNEPFLASNVESQMREVKKKEKEAKEKNERK